MKLIERLKLLSRANKYKNKNDRGGISYLISTVKQGQTVLDIGAHKAGYLYFLLNQVGKEGKVYAFEPQSNLYNYLTKIKRLFAWNNVVVEHMAISDKAGTVTLYIPVNEVSKGSSPGATIVENQAHQGSDMTETVAAETLDTYCRLHKIKPDFLKIDVEGNELSVFRGGVETLREFKPSVIVEIEARHVGQDQVLDTFKFMESLGYAGHFIHGINRHPLAEFSFELHQNIGDSKNYCNNFTFEHV